MRTFCESGGKKSAKRDLGVAVVLPPWFYHPWVYQSCFHAVGIYINKTGTVLFPLAINCLCVWMSPFHFESVTLCVCARNNLTSNCEQKRTLHFSMTDNFFSMTGNFFASPGNFFAFDSLHFWMTKCTERRLLLLRGSAKRDRP